MYDTVREKKNDKTEKQPDVVEKTRQSVSKRLKRGFYLLKGEGVER